MILEPADFFSVYSDDNLFQSGFWGFFKADVEDNARAFSVRYGSSIFPFIIIQRRIARGIPYIYAPRAPQIRLPEDQQGPFLESLARKLLPYIPANTAFIRFDTLWHSPFTDDAYYTERKQWKGPPRQHIREIRMNYFTEEKNLRKASTDLLPPDTILMNLAREEDDIFMSMRQNTRNCIRRAYRHGVTVRDVPIEYLPDWYELYRQTAARKNITAHRYDYFYSLFTAAESYSCRTDENSIAPVFKLLMATQGGDILSGMILGIHGKTAYYLYAGSSMKKRHFMPNYRLLWEAIKIARSMGCSRYDLFGIPPNNDPGHVQHGLYTFKTGFGGNIIHYRGCWDYPLDECLYSTIKNVESFH